MYTVDRLTRIYPTGYTVWDVYHILCDAYSISIGLAGVQSMSKQDFQTKMQTESYVKIEGVRRDREKYLILLLDKNDKDSNELISSAEKFKIFINKCVTDKIDRLILVTPTKISQTMELYLNGLNCRASAYTYEDFKIVKPLGPNVPRARIMPPDEIRELSKTLDGIEHVQKIKQSDTLAVWLDAQPGEIIWIERDQKDHAMKSSNLRKVV